MFAKLKDLKHCIFYTTYNGSMVFSISAVAFVSIEVRHVHNGNEKKMFSFCNTNIRPCGKYMLPLNIVYFITNLTIKIIPGHVVR